MAQQPAPIRRRKLADEIEARILEHIQENRLKPGDTLPSERELMLLFSVGRPAIREAMQSLQRKGLAAIKHGERPKVAEASFATMAGQMSETMRHLLSHNAATMDHLKEARIAFESEMARIAAQRASAEDVANLRGILRLQQQARSEPRVFMQRDGEFHAALGAISGNPIFASLSASLFDWLAHFHVDLVRRPGLEQLTLAEHDSIVSAIEAGDPELAGQHMADHLNRANSLYHQDNLTN